LKFSRVEYCFSAKPHRLLGCVVCFGIFLLALSTWAQSPPEILTADAGVIRQVPDLADEARFNWNGALRDSTLLLVVEQSFRLTQDPKNRRGLSGPFLRDYLRSVKNVSGWSDGDSFLTNYVGHPLRGAITGYIEVRHDPRFHEVEFGGSRDYWTSRMRAMGFSAVYSLGFEIGPFSEASLGNIQTDPRKRGVVDWVVTPTVGTAWMVGEDFADKHLIRAVESRTDNRVVLALVRSLLNPGRTLSNLASRRVPWERNDRLGINALAGMP
jgi:hypothetical protein